MKPGKFTHIIGVVAIAWCSLGAQANTTASSLTDEEKADLGKSYAQKWKDSDEGFGDSSNKIAMTLFDKGGNQSTRFMRMGVVESNSDTRGDKVLLTFEAPANVKDSRVLIHSMIREGDLVWLYLPSIKRVKRVSSADRAGSFSGSEFSYEDIGSMEVGNYDYVWLRDEPCGEMECAVVKQIPLYPYSGYSSIDVWFDKTHYRQMKIKFYDRKGTHFKTLELSDYEQFLDRYWRPITMTMENHATGKKTILKSSDIEFQIGQRETDYEPGKLKNLTQ